MKWRHTSVDKSSPQEIWENIVSGFVEEYETRYDSIPFKPTIPAWEIILYSYMRVEHIEKCVPHMQSMFDIEKIVVWDNNMNFHLNEILKICGKDEVLLRGVHFTGEDFGFFIDINPEPSSLISESLAEALEKAMDTDWSIDGHYETSITSINDVARKYAMSLTVSGVEKYLDNLPIERSFDGKNTWIVPDVNHKKVVSMFNGEKLLPMWLNESGYSVAAFFKREDELTDKVFIREFNGGEL